MKRILVFLVALVAVLAIAGTALADPKPRGGGDQPGYNSVVSHG